MVHRHHHDLLKILQGRQCRAVGQTDTLFPAPGTQFALHRIYVAGEACEVLHCGFAWKHRRRPTTHGPLGHSTKCRHGRQGCFLFGDHGVPRAHKSRSGDCELLSCGRLLRRCHEVKLLHRISYRRDIRAFFDHGRMTECQLFQRSHIHGQSTNLHVQISR